MGIIDQVKILIQQKSDEYQASDPGQYDFWNGDLKYAYHEAIELAKRYGADLEIVQLGALLHGIALLEKVGTKADHHEDGKVLAEIERQQQRLDSMDQGYYVTVEYLLNLFEHAADIFKVANSNEKRQILSMLLSNLYFDGENLTYTLKEPLAGLFLKKRSSVWQGLKDLILNPTKYMVALGEFNVECARALLKNMGPVLF